MDTKALASAIVGFLLGGFVVSVAATQSDQAPHGGGSDTTMSGYDAGDDQHTMR